MVKNPDGGGVKGAAADEREPAGTAAAAALVADVRAGMKPAQSRARRGSGGGGDNYSSPPDEQDSEPTFIRNSLLHLIRLTD